MGKLSADPSELIKSLKAELIQLKEENQNMKEKIGNNYWRSRMNSQMEADTKLINEANNLHVELKKEIKALKAELNKLKQDKDLK